MSFNTRRELTPMSIRCSKVFAIVLSVTLCPLAYSQKEFTHWPAGSSPKVVGKRVAGRFLASPHLLVTQEAAQPYINYSESVTWYGGLTFAQLSHDKKLQSQLIKRFQTLFGDDARLIPEPKHVDLTVFSAVPLELYLQTRQQKYLDLGKKLADKQWAQTTPDGLTIQTRYWIDDMYMITIAQVQAFRATGDASYLDHAALEMSVYLDNLQQPNGLFYHAPDVPFFWGRGNGWVAAGLAELLRSLPQNHPRRARILDAYRKMMASLLKYQANDGMWRQLIDHPEAWPETSSTGMFTFAMVTGLKNGWLDEKTYAPAARKAWLALLRYLEPNGDIREVCEGTGKKNDLQYYLDRKRITGDFHGQAPILWTASALLR
jgi:unsaturated rhamnogalacturonyl hydrolase